MTKSSLFRSSVFSENFNVLQEMLKAQCHSQGFPFYNLVNGDTENEYLVEVSLAGYDKSEITVTKDGDILTIKSELTKSDKEEREFIHKGITKKNFVREFKLAEHTEVDKVTFKNGILRVELYREVPEKEKAKTFEIK